MLVIADMVKNGYYSNIHSTSEELEELRVLLSNRDAIVKRIVSAINQLHRWVDLVFPELRQVFKDITCSGSYTVYSSRCKSQLLLIKRKMFNIILGEL